MRAQLSHVRLRSLTALMIGGTVALVCGCIAILVWVLNVSTASVDTTAKNGESRLIGSAIEIYTGQLATTVIDYATWDALFKNFMQTRDSQWEQDNLGPSITTQLGVDYVVVAGKDGVPAYLYSKTRKGTWSPTLEDRISLLALVRAAVENPVPREGTPVQGAVWFDGSVQLVAATPVVSSKGAPSDFVLLEFRSLNSAFLAMISRNFGLNHLRIAGPWEHGIVLEPAAGKRSPAQLIWTPAQAGLHLFARVLPAVVFTGMLLLLLFCALLGLWWTILERMRASDARAMTAEIEAARARAIVAEESARNKNTFIANMNHELRTPLNAIIGFSELIRTEAFGPLGSPKYREYIQDINEAGEHLLGIINDILLISKVDADQFTPELEPVSFKAILTAVVRMMEPIAGKRNVWINTFRCTTDASLDADKQALRQVLLNVISNAVKFSPENGGIDIEAEERADGVLEIRVVDYGRGIPPDTLKDIGKPFVQAETAYTRNYQGTGLGLAISYRLVEAMGGTITIDSAVNVKTTVTIRLKIARTAAQKGHVAA